MATPARSQFDNHYFFEKIVHADHRILVIDFDTVLRCCVTPLRAKLRLPTVTELLDCIITSRCSRVIVASGRKAHEVAGQLAPPYPEVWGRHGAERISPGGTGVTFCVHARRSFPAAEGAENAEQGTDESRESDLFRARSASSEFAAVKSALPGLLHNMCARGPLAYIRGELGAGLSRVLVRPQFYLSQTEVAAGTGEDLIQFLGDWLWACAGEVC